MGLSKSRDFIKEMKERIKKRRPVMGEIQQRASKNVILRKVQNESNP